MDRRDRVGLGQAQQVAVAAQVARVVAEALAAEVGLAEPVGLEHRAHRAVEDEDPLAQEAGQRGRGARRGRTAWPAASRRAARRDVRCRDGRHEATAAAGWRARIRRTSSAHCS